MTEEEIKTLQDELESTRGELAGLMAQKEALNSQLSARDARVSELEKAIAAKDSELATLEQTIAESNDTINKLQEDLSQAIANYKALVVQSNPDVPEELIGGDTIETINSSLQSAKELVHKVRQGVEAEISSARFPAGAPERTPPDLSALSPREKIQYAIGGKR